MPNQPTLADPIPVWAPATYSSPVNNPSAPRVGWFVVDGTCHGEPAHGGHTNALGSNLYASDDGTAKCLQSESEEDAVTSELPVGSPASAAIDGASPTLATLRDNTNVTAVAPASATEPQVSSNMMQDAGHRTDSGRAAASEQGGDENAPTMGTSGLMSVAGVLALWARSRNTSEELWSEDENEEYEADSEEDDEHGDEDDEEDDEGAVDNDEDDEDNEDEVEDDEEDVPLRVRVTSPLYRYLGYESRYH